MELQQDLMEWLSSQYREELSLKGTHLTAPEIDCLNKFIDASRRALANNAVAGVDYTETGLALRMQDSQLILLVHDHNGGDPLQPGNYAHITKPEEHQRNQGIDRGASYSFDITGADQK